MSASDRFRPDIQGMRTIAVALVVLYHAGLPGLPGGYVGVDMFFVISGFLITSHLTTQLETSGRIRLADFYARRVRRLLPAALTVVLLTVVAAVIFISPLRLVSILQDAIATVLYAPNLLFAVQGTDYLADVQPSPFLHYWSLGVEEQFYLIWPLLLLLAFRLFHKTRHGIVLGIAALVVISFVACVWLTGTNQPYAFYLLPFRAWELGIGGLVALIVSAGWNKRIPAPVMTGLGWAGILGLAAATVFFDSGTAFPGAAAALPVLSAAAIILGGSTAPRGGPRALLSLRPMQWVGTLSYSIYLVHWPILVITGEALGHPDDLPLWFTLLLAAITVPLAMAMYRWVEEPGRKFRFLAARRPRVTLVGTAAVMAVVIAVSGGGIAYARTMPLDAGRSAAPAAIVADPVGTPFVPDNLSPALRAAEGDNPALYANGCHLDYLATAVQDCVEGDPASGPTVALFGDSHATQWYPALSGMVAQRGGSLASYTKSACPSAEVTVQRAGGPYTTCNTWRESVLRSLEADPPDVVVLANRLTAPVIADSSADQQEWVAGLEQTVQRLSKVTRVIVVADNPEFAVAPSICLSQHLSSADDCAADPGSALNASLQSAMSAAVVEGGGEVLDLNEYLCSATACPAIIGDTLVYRDENHITATFSAALAPVFAARIEPAAG